MSLAYSDKVFIPSMWEDTEEDVKKYKENMKKEQAKLRERRESIE